MSDRNRTVDFFDSLGIKLDDYDDSIGDGSTTLFITAKEQPKVTGYRGFTVDFEFDVDGNFIRMGIWE